MGRKLKGRQFQAKGLKGALQVHIAQEKVKQDTQRALEAQSQTQKDKAKSVKSGGAKKRQPVHVVQKKAFIPFSPNETLLLVGEGDFSFACALVRQDLILPENLIATGFDSETEMQTKYPEAMENVKFLKESGVSVLHEVDATNLMQSLKLKSLGKNQRVRIFENGKRLNYVMFNFPHNGRGIKDVDRNIREHQKLVLGYFKSCIALFDVVNKRSNSAASGYLSEEDSTAEKIVMSLFEGEPYISWGVKALSRSVGYRVERSGAFDWPFFAGYHHRRTNSMKDTTKPASERDARIYLFDKALSKEEFEKLTGKKSKKRDDDSDED
ncbi:hypothetical protein METBIDRAFT_79647 [Metschnikowia bicuspidata var. bicuspidata NRRL YB-4993]|uniref:25S rRNA (uridine-N(3))-methyltransferase BMT5-like domain-containing protein n=1 Tax=Metschnikowia bicuspidata var. bicuspidata NRRL YB-4993 TaxID=869754 RepID=A0A1A0H6R7_9ASCO|nr:hypothetical protein METBIDRAFT_79647 [Metschnikowia bicuspidata var. bicuspidata NRRL YB-4993]OBA19650.1 hypothetical protein METBIDRAFT_79647 [Metschnikowia bicuspidata var. bicuspidata NRRL YB-4993]